MKVKKLSIISYYKYKKFNNKSTQKGASLIIYRLIVKIHHQESFKNQIYN